MSEFFDGSNKNDNGRKRDAPGYDSDGKKMEAKLVRWDSSDDEDKNDYSGYNYDKPPSYESTPERSPPKKDKDYFTE